MQVLLDNYRTVPIWLSFLLWFTINSFPEGTFSFLWLEVKEIAHSHTHAHARTHFMDFGAWRYRRRTVRLFQHNPFHPTGAWDPCGTAPALRLSAINISEGEINRCEESAGTAPYDSGDPRSHPIGGWRRHSREPTWSTRLSRSYGAKSSGFWIAAAAHFGKKLVSTGEEEPDQQTQQLLVKSLKGSIEFLLHHSWKPKRDVGYKGVGEDMKASKINRKRLRLLPLWPHRDFPETFCQCKKWDANKCTQRKTMFRIKREVNINCKQSSLSPALYARNVG